MAPLPFNSSQSGTRITVNDWLKDPTRVPVYVLSLMNQGFLADAVLRPGGSAPAGVVRFEESTPLYADSSVTNRAEGSEVPVTTVSRGVPNVAYSQDKALRLIITEEMRRRNSIDMFQTGITQVVNTMIRAFDDMFISAVLSNANINSKTVTTAWATSSGTTPRKDIMDAAKLIEGAQDGQGAELGYEADTLIVNRATKFDLINSADFNQIYTYGGNIADEHLQYTGKLPQKILDYDVLFSPRVPSGTAILCQRNVCGSIFDEVPLKVYDMVEDRNRLSWSSIVQRVSAVAIDKPKSICKLVGV